LYVTHLEGAQPSADKWKDFGKKMNSFSIFHSWIKKRNCSKVNKNHILEIAKNMAHFLPLICGYYVDQAGSIDPTQKNGCGETILAQKLS